MPCSPLDNTLNPDLVPGIPIPGFGLPFSPLQVPVPDFDLPTDLLEDLLDLLNKVKLPWPGLLEISPTLDGATKTIFDTIAKVLNLLAPFLGFYNFIMALLNLIVCVIEVLCAIPNPWAVASKLKKLFAECLPPFLNLFPWLALIAMIIALLLLILALIEYIIATILAIIAAILRNLAVFADAAKLSDAQSTLAAAQKIASLLCFIQNLLSILVAIAAIIAIIKSLSLIGGGAVCDDNDASGCCAPATCPPFIKNNPDGILVTNGKLVYYNQIGTDIGEVFADLNIPNIEELFNFAPLRSEKWQIYNTGSAPLYPINLITTPVVSGTFPPSINIFWPDPLDFKADTSPSKAPYTVDLKITVNPADFGHPADGYGSVFARTFQIKDCIVITKPYVGVFNHRGMSDFTVAQTGTLSIQGGLVYEEDGTTPYELDGEQATLNTFIHETDSLGSLPAFDDALSYDVEFTWKPNTPALAQYQLVTVGCIPEVSIEKAVQNAIISAEGSAPIISRLSAVPSGDRVASTGDFLPNILGAVECVQSSLAKFRTDVSNTGAAEFQASVETCLGDLRSQTLATICDAITKGVSQFKSSTTLNTDVEFTTRAIKAKVVLMDGSGTIISTNIPSDCADKLEDLLVGEVTLGAVSKFAYDGTQAFNADITSDQAGEGELTVTFNGKVFNKIVAATDDTNSSIVENVLNYTFIDATTEGPVRRDAGDVARNGI